MLNFLKIEANRAVTENGAASLASTGSECLDLFVTVGAPRSASDREIIHRFRRAYAENPDLAMKTLFFARDVRGGLGERRVFRVALHWLASEAPGSVRKNLPHVAEFGRWDDLLTLLGTPCEKDALTLIEQQLDKDRVALEVGGEVSLLAKWLPSVNASDPETVRRAKKLARSLGLTDAAYRKLLVKLRARIRILENNLREKDYTFDYSKQPSKAMHKYRKAFLRNDSDRYRAFLDRVSRGEELLNTGTLTPYDVIAPCFAAVPDEEERRSLDVTWKALEDFTNGENALVVADGSGSMYGPFEPRPIAVALSLAIYFAQRNTGAFRNHFITFSRRPRLVEIKGRDICEQVSYCKNYNEVSNTDVQKVFELILRTAVLHRLPQSEMPSTLYFISDMEFNQCTASADMTNFDYARKIFARAGYQLPRVVFWNVASRTRQQPVRRNEQGVALVSGCSPRIFQMLADGNLDPMGWMLSILGTERYEKIAA